MKTTKHALAVLTSIVFNLAIASPLLAFPGAAEDAKAFSAAENASALKNHKEKLSYAIGVSLAQDFRERAIEVDPGLLMRGLKDAASGGKMLLTAEELQAILVGLENERRARAFLAAKELGEKNDKAGESFLAANKSKEGVVTLASGLQYKILKAGDGQKPKSDDYVVCQYRGTFIDGTEFDNSYKRNQPVTFALNRTIKGWSEALQLMPVGSKWQLFISPQLAYGERGATGVIGPNATLVFELELISIKDTSSADARASQKQGATKADVGVAQKQ